MSGQVSGTWLRFLVSWILWSLSPGSWGFSISDPRFKLFLKNMRNKKISRKCLKWLELRGSAELATKFENFDSNAKKLQKHQLYNIWEKNFFSLLNYKNLSTMHFSGLCFQSTSCKDSLKWRNFLHKKKISAVWLTPLVIWFICDTRMIFDASLNSSLVCEKWLQ